MGGGGEAWAPICRAAEHLGVRARGWKAGEIFGEHHGVRLHGEGKMILAAGPGLSAGCELRGRTGRVRARCREGPGGRTGCVRAVAERVKAGALARVGCWAGLGEREPGVRLGREAADWAGAGGWERK